MQDINFLNNFNNIINNEEVMNSQQDNFNKATTAAPITDPRNITLKRFLNKSFEIDSKK